MSTESCLFGSPPCVSFLLMSCSSAGDIFGLDCGSLVVKWICICLCLVFQAFHWPRVNCIHFSVRYFYFASMVYIWGWLSFFPSTQNLDWDGLLCTRLSLADGAVLVLLWPPYLRHEPLGAPHCRRGSLTNSHLMCSQGSFHMSTQNPKHPTVRVCSWVGSCPPTSLHPVSICGCHPHSGVLFPLQSWPLKSHFSLGVLSSLFFCVVIQSGISSVYSLALLCGQNQKLPLISYIIP